MLGLKTIDHLLFLQAKSNVPKGTNPRKKWRKSTIVLVTDPPPSLQSDKSEVAKKENNNISEASVSTDIPQKMPSTRFENASVAPKAESNFIETDIPLKIPRAMRKQVPSNGGGLPLGERNISKPDESVNKKDPEVLVQPKSTLEKENSGL